MDNLNFIERLKKVANVREDRELAELFEMSKAGFSYAKKNNSFSMSSLIKFSQQFDVDLHWLITGEEKAPALNEMEVELLKRFNQLDFSQKLAAFNQIGAVQSEQCVHHIAQTSKAGDNYSISGCVDFKK